MTQQTWAKRGWWQWCLFWSMLTLGAQAADWPTWRGDAARRAVTSESLPADLKLQWSLRLPPAAPAWPEDPRLQFDGRYEPVVVGEQLFVASNVEDSVSAYDVTTSELRWRYFAGGPVRFAPVVSNARVYFGADDGCVYCLRAADGSLEWKHQAAPTARRVLGSERIVSVWPIRGGLAVDGDKLFFAFGVWPFEGTFLAALDAKSGQPTSVADAGPATPVLLKERTPQGYLVASDGKLFIPCGRSTVAVFDRAAGDFVAHTYKTSEVTTYHAAASGRWLFHGAQAYDLQSKTTANVTARHAVLAADTAYYGEKGTVQAVELANPKFIEGKDRFGKEARRTELVPRWAWNWNSAHGIETPPLKKGEKPVPVPPVQIDLLASKQLIGHRQSTLFALNLAEAPDAPPTLAWELTIAGTPESVIAAAGRLLVVTAEGTIHCYGSATAPNRAAPNRAAPNVARRPEVDELLKVTGVTGGYVVAYGAVESEWCASVASRPDLRLIAVVEAAAEVERLRRELASLGVYGARAAVVHSSPIESQLPPYLANLIVCDKQISELAAREPAALAELFRVLRPYGGVATLTTDAAGHERLVRLVAELGLAGAELRREGERTLLTRVGALPGSANWTHEYGDPGNTLMSRDELVRAPLGVLWFGGPAASGELFYNRHFWGPSMAVIDGRMLVQGPKKLSAIDVYTGRILWLKQLEHDDRNNPGRRGQDFENALMGYNFVAVPDSIYLVQGPELLVLDPVDGRERARWKLPQGDLWGTLRVQGEWLVAEAFPEKGEHVGKPRRVVVVDRKTGKVAWSQEANLSFPVTAVGPDRVYVFDADIENFYLDWKRKGLVPKANEIRTLRAFALATGKPVWERSTDQVVTWLGYSAEHDVLVASNKQHIAARGGKDGVELWQKEAEGVGFKGHPESLWDKLIIWKDRILDQRGPGLAYNLRTGESVRQNHPATGEPIDWEFTKTGHHCNYAIANPYLMTFRADTAGFCDIESGNTARLEGFRSGCRNSLIPANGVLNSPNFAHGCVCGYSLFTSLGLVHAPNNELWGYNPLKPGTAPVRRIGINLGGRGDRVAPTGTLWLEYPNVSGTLLGTTVKVAGGSPRYFQHHASFVRGGPEQLPWVAASGVEGATSVEVRWEDAKQAKPRQYRVRLIFLEPDAKVKIGERMFDVKLQGTNVAEGLDVVAEAKGALAPVIKTFDAVEATGELRIELTPRGTRGAILSGIEVEAAP